MSEHLYRKHRINNAANAGGTNLDDLVSKNVLAQLKRDPPPPSKEHSSGGGKAPAVDSSDLISSMAKRLSVLEREMKQRQTLLSQIQEENTALKSKLKVAEEEIARRALAALSPRIGAGGAAGASSSGGGGAGGSGGDAPAEDISQHPLVVHLRSENARLRGQLRYAWKQVTDMKAFLNDYGMVWVGDPESDAQMADFNMEELAAIPSSGGAGPLGPPKPTGHVLGSGPAANRTGEPSTSAPSGGQGYILGGRPRSRGRISQSGEAHDVQPSPTGADGSGAGGSSSSGPAPAKRPSGMLAPMPPRPPTSEPPNGPNLARQSSFTGVASSASTSSKPPAAGQQLDRSASHNAASSSSSAGGAAPPSSSVQPLSNMPAASSNGVPPAPLSRRSVPLEKLAPLQAPHGGSKAAEQPKSDPMPFTMNELMVKVDELNQLADDGIGRMVQAAGGAVLSTPEPVHLSVFKNGIQLHTQAARGFNDPSSKSIIRDIMDGYFPYVLKREFPDGVPIRVVDRTGESYEAALAGGGSPTRAGNVRSFNDVVESHSAASAGAPLSKAQFLNKLPNQVIRNGKVIEIKGEISKFMEGADKAGAAAAAAAAAKPSVSVLASPVDPLLSTMQRNHAGPSLPPPSREGARPAEEIATLQVRNEDGKQTFIVKLKFDDTIGMLKKCIDEHRAKAASDGGAGAAPGGAYEIRTAFPAKAYTEMYETLRQAGLVPNATLFLRSTAGR